MDVFDLPNEKSLVGIGINIYREGFDTNSCEYGFLFRKFDYCGGLIKEKVYRYFDSVVLIRSTYSGVTDNNTIASYGFSGFNITHKGTYSYFMGTGSDSHDQLYNVLLILDENGEIVVKKIFLENKLLYAQHIVVFNDDRILSVLFDQLNGKYTFRWLLPNGDIRKQNGVAIPNYTLLYYVKESVDNQLYFTAKKYLDDDPNSIMVLKIDTLGNQVWKFEEHGNLGSNRDILVKDTSLIICALEYDSNFVEKKSLALIELNTEGKLLTRKRIETGNYFMTSLSVSLIESKNQAYYIAANLHKGSPVQRSISIISLSQDFQLLWFKQFYKKDNISFGHAITECSDGGLAIVGVDRQLRPNEYGSVIIKTTKDTPVGTVSDDMESLLSVFPNPVSEYLLLHNENHELYHYFIYTADGELIEGGKTNQSEILVSGLAQGIHFIKLLDNGGNSKVIKFMKAD